MPSNTIDDLKRVIIDSVEARAKDFLESHADAKAFLYDRAKRLAELAFDYTLVDTDEEKQRIKEKMELVQQTIENELSSIAVDAAVEAKSTFVSILKTALDVFIKMLPAIMAAL